MAKKPKPPTYRVEFEGTGLVFENVRYKEIPSMGNLHFCHLEHKPGGWILLVTEGFLTDDDTLKPIVNVGYSKSPNIPNLLVRDGVTCPVTKSTLISMYDGSDFYHLDELKDHTFRITRSRNLFPRDLTHAAVSRITFTKELPCS